MPRVLHRRRSRRIGTGPGLVALVALVALACGDVRIEAVGAGGAPPGGAGSGGGATLEPPPGGSDDPGTPSTPPEPRLLPGDQLFGDDEVLEIHLTVEPADLAALEEHGNEETYVRARATITGSRIGEVSFTDLGLRHKGAWTLHHCWDEFGVRSYEGSCAKLSYKLKFDEYLPEVRLDGVKRLNLHSASNDPTRLHELLAYRTFRDFGVEAPRTAVAKVFVNGNVEGLFIAVEAIDGRFTKAHFPSGGGDGNLYKEIWPSPELDMERLAASLRTNEDVGDVSAFVGFASAVSASSSTSFASDVGPWVDLDQVLRYIAVDRALKNWDGIMAFYSDSSPHNFYWYHDSGGSGRFLLVPWDLDNTFWEYDPFMSPDGLVGGESVPDWNEEPESCRPRSVWDMTYSLAITPPRCDRFLDLLAETQFERFQTFAAELLAGPFELSRLQAKFHAYSALLQPIIASDPHMDLGEWLREKQLLELRLERAVSDFEAFALGGLRHEGSPTPPQELEPVVADVGLDPARLNGFEFTAGSPGPAPNGTYAYGSDGATFSVSWNATAPLDGARDLRFDFQFTRQPSLWDEWVNFGYSTSNAEEVDLTGHRTLVMSLRADRARSVRVRLASPAYEDSFGGVWSEFGVDLAVSSTPSTVELQLDDFAYPVWAKAAWQVGQGWATSDAEAFALVRQRVTGVIFAPAATRDASGELSTQSEAGYLQVDDIAFRE